MEVKLMGRKKWEFEGGKDCCTKKRNGLGEQDVQKLNDSEKEKVHKEEAIFIGADWKEEEISNEEAISNEEDGTNYPKSRDEQLLNHPSEWTAENIDKVARAVKLNPLAENASVFWNIYKGPFNALPYNDPLRIMILKAKRSYSAYYPISDEEYLGDVMALMGAKKLADWLPEKETLEQYIRCRCRPHAEYGRSILKAHGNTVYALVKKDGRGSFKVCEISKYNLAHYPGYTKKYVNQQLMSIDAITQEDGEYLFKHLYENQEERFAQSEEKSIRQWLMKACRVTEYEMQICEAIVAYGKCLDAKIVKEINEAIVLPSGNPPMTQKEISLLNNRVHKRAQYHYQKAIEGIR